jgi:ubiquinone/menaquinone biosynthesis C-methylase UbiE
VGEDIKMLKTILSLNPNDYIKVVNVGCGPAIYEQHFLSLLEKKISWYWVAIDISTQMVTKVKNLNSSCIDCIVSEGGHLPFREYSFDLVIVSRAIKFMNLIKTFRNIRQVIKNSALLFLVADVADAIWCRLLEKIGLRIDPSIYNNMKTLRTFQILEKLRESDLKVLATIGITSLPLKLFGCCFKINTRKPFFSYFDSIRIMRPRIVVFICKKVK